MDLVKYNTDRGFRRISFKDYYGNYCSFQESSLADVEAIWFGIDEALPKQLVKGEGWEKNPKSIVTSLIFKFFGDIRDALNKTEVNDEKSYN